MNNVQEQETKPELKQLPFYPRIGNIGEIVSLKEDTGPTKELSPKMQLMLKFHIYTGLSISEAAAKVSMSVEYARQIARGKLGQNFIAQCQADLDIEFRNLFGKAIEAIRDGLDYADPTIRLAAANLWGKMSGKFTQKLDVTVSAEDVVQDMMKDKGNGNGNGKENMD